MAQTTINNGDSGLIARNAINGNFTELYGKMPYVTVGTGGDYATVRQAYQAGKKNIKIISNVVESGNTNVIDFISIFSEGNYTIVFGTYILASNANSIVYLRDINCTIGETPLSNYWLTGKSILSNVTLTYNGKYYKINTTSAIWNNVTVNLYNNNTSGNNQTYIDGIFNKCNFVGGGTDTRGYIYASTKAIMNYCTFSGTYKAPDTGNYWSGLKTLSGSTTLCLNNCTNSATNFYISNSGNCILNYCTNQFNFHSSTKYPVVYGSSVKFYLDWVYGYSGSTLTAFNSIIEFSNLLNGSSTCNVGNIDIYGCTFTFNKSSVSETTFGNLKFSNCNLTYSYFLSNNRTTVKITSLKIINSTLLDAASIITNSTLIFDCVINSTLTITGDYITVTKSKVIGVFTVDVTSDKTIIESCRSTNAVVDNGTNTILSNNLLI